MAVHHDDGFRRRTPRSRLSVGAAVMLAALTAGTLFVAFLLPTYMTSPPDSVVAPAQSTPVPSPAPSAAQQMIRAAVDADRPEAEKLLAEALRRIAKLEGEGARIWGNVAVDGLSLAGAEETLTKANSFYDRQQYKESLPPFRDAIATFDRLAESKPERFRRAMSAGEQAFASGDAATARSQFEIAVALMPGDAAAARSLERARTLPEVLANMARGQSAESSGALTAARDAYRIAVSLDGDFAAARESLARVETQIAANDYRAAVSDAHTRLNQGDLRAAQAALDRARRINPNAPELADLRQRLQTAAQIAGLARLSTQATELERQEKWSDAVKAYDQALGLDPNAAFARSGRARAQHLAQLHAALDQYIAEPARLQSGDPRNHARTLLAQAESETGPMLSAKRRQLAELIAAAETPVPVLLKSDQSTEVTLQRIGRLGTFELRRIELPPGRYLAIGSRAGYRDVRVPFEVSATPRTEPIVVQATEPIR